MLVDLRSNAKACNGVLAVAAFFLLLLEVALARWISMSRRTAEEVKVEFEERGGPDAAILEKMDRLKKVG